jgi:hypothetical protein
VDGGPPQHGQDRDPDRPRPRAAVWVTVAGIILGAAAVICLGYRAIAVPQAIAMALPAVLLVIGGVIWGASPDLEAGGWRGFQAGFQLGSLVSRLRAFFRRRGDGG